MIGQNRVVLDGHDHQLIESIKTHLSDLLNSRSGCLDAYRDHGLPDLCQIYQGLPYTLNHLMQSIKHTIEKYEPRLQDITITPISDETESVITIELKATLCTGGKVSLTSFFMADCSANMC